MERVGEILRSVLSPEMVAKAELWHRFFSAWPALVGPELAGLARLAEVERGEAIVEVEHPAVLQLVALRKREVLQRIRREFPEAGVQGLRVQVVPRFGQAGGGLR